MILKMAIFYSFKASGSTFSRLHQLLLKSFKEAASGSGRGVCGQNICYHVAAFVILFNLICNMTMF